MRYWQSAAATGPGQASPASSADKLAAFASYHGRLHGRVDDLVRRNVRLVVHAVDLSLVRADVAHGQLGAALLACVCPTKNDAQVSDRARAGLEPTDRAPIPAHEPSSGPASRGLPAIGSGRGGRRHSHLKQNPWKTKSLIRWGLSLA